MELEFKILPKGLAKIQNYCIQRNQSSDDGESSDERKSRKQSSDERESSDEGKSRKQSSDDGKSLDEGKSRKQSSDDGKSLDEVLVQSSGELESPDDVF